MPKKTYLLSFYKWLTITVFVSWIQYHLLSESRQLWHRNVALGTQWELHPSVCITFCLQSVCVYMADCVCSGCVTHTQHGLVCVCVRGCLFIFPVSQTPAQSSFSIWQCKWCSLSSCGCRRRLNPIRWTQVPLYCWWRLCSKFPLALLYRCLTHILISRHCPCNCPLCFVIWHVIWSGLPKYFPISIFFPICFYF